MTIGIGLACESGDCLILAADTRGTYKSGHIHANEEVGKQFELPVGFHACIAGRLVYCQLVIAYLQQRIEEFKITPENVMHDHFRVAMRLAQADTVRDLYDNAMVRETGMHFDEWKEIMQKSPVMFRRGKEMFKRTELVAELLVGGFSQSNFVLLFFVDKNPVEIVHSHETIGSGADLAMNKLNDRGQNIHMSFQRSVLHVAEALEEAKLDPGVGDAADWVVLEKNGRMARLPAKQRVITDLVQAYAGRISDALDGDDAIRNALKGILMRQSPSQQ